MTETRSRQARLVTDAALAQPGREDLFTDLLERIRELRQVDTAVVMLLDHTTQELVATAARGIDEDVRHGVRLPVGRGFAGRVAARRRAEVVVHPVHEDLLHPPLVHMGIRSLLGVRLLNDDRVIGVLHVGTLADRRFTDEEINLLQLVANQASDAAQARLSGIERAATLSRYPAGPPCSICHPTSRSVLEPPRDDIALLTAAAPRPTSPGTA